MNIILEGLWYGPAKLAAEAMATNHPEGVSRVIACPPVIDTPNMVSWMDSMTRCSELWRKHASIEDVIVFKHSFWSCGAYTAVFSEMSPHEMSGQEHKLFMSIINGLSELMLPPDLVVLFEWDTENQPPAEVDLYLDSDMDTLKEIEKSLEAWASRLEAQGVNVIRVKPPRETKTISSWRTWYKGVNLLIENSIRDWKANHDQKD